MWLTTRLVDHVARHVHVFEKSSNNGTGPIYVGCWTLEVLCVGSSNESRGHPPHYLSTATGYDFPGPERCERLGPAVGRDGSQVGCGNICSPSGRDLFPKRQMPMLCMVLGRWRAVFRLDRFEGREVQGSTEAKSRVLFDTWFVAADRSGQPAMPLIGAMPFRGSDWRDALSWLSVWRVDADKVGDSLACQPRRSCALADGRSSGRSVGRAVHRGGGRAVSRSGGRSGGRAVWRSFGRTVGRADGWAVGRADGPAIGRADGRSEGRGTVGRLVGRADGRAVRRTVGRSVARSDGRSDGRSGGQCFWLVGCRATVGRRVGRTVDVSSGCCTGLQSAQGFERNVLQVKPTRKGKAESIGRGRLGFHDIRAEQAHPLSRRLLIQPCPASSGQRPLTL